MFLFKRSNKKDKIPVFAVGDSYDSTIKELDRLEDLIMEKREEILKSIVPEPILADFEPVNTKEQNAYSAGYADGWNDLRKQIFDN
nr:MAG TPA: hypothetical protein [Caudoviricetes sp.]